jgi:hypothetical protein
MSKEYNVEDSTDVIFPAKFPVTGSRLVCGGNADEFEYVTTESLVASNWYVNDSPRTTLPKLLAVVHVTVSEYVIPVGKDATAESARMTLSEYVPRAFAGSVHRNTLDDTYVVLLAFVVPITTNVAGPNPVPSTWIYPPSNPRAVSSIGTQLASVIWTLLMMSGRTTPVKLLPFPTKEDAVTVPVIFATLASILLA